MGWSVFLSEAMLFLYPSQALKFPKLITFVIYRQNLQYYPGSGIVFSNLAVPLKPHHCSLPFFQVEAQKAKVEIRTQLESTMRKEKNNDSNNINAKGWKLRNYLHGKPTTINKHWSALLHHLFSPVPTPLLEGRVLFPIPNIGMRW